MNRLFRLATSKTVLGTIAAVLGWAAQQPVIDKPTIIKGLGTVLLSAGISDKFNKIHDALKS